MQLEGFNPVSSDGFNGSIIQYITSFFSVDNLDVGDISLLIVGPFLHLNEMLLQFFRFNVIV